MSEGLLSISHPWPCWIRRATEIAVSVVVLRKEIEGVVSLMSWTRDGNCYLLLSREKKEKLLFRRNGGRYKMHN